MDDLQARFSKMTVAELSFLGARSVAEIVLYALGQAGNRPAAPKAQAPGKKVSTSAQVVDVSTPAGRERYDAAIMDALRKAKGPLRSEDLRARVGGTAHQLRARLNRMIERGEVTYTGRARSTKYEAV